MFGKTIHNHLDKYFGAGNGAETLEQRLFWNYEFLATIAPFIPTKAMEAITDPQNQIHVHEACANKEVVVATEANVVQEPPAHTS